MPLFVIVEKIFFRISKLFVQNNVSCGIDISEK